MSVSKEEVLGLIDSYKGAIEYWNISISEPKCNPKDLKMAQVDNPLEELKKLVTLIKAYTTKIGIAFELKNLKKGYKPGYDSLKEMAEKLVLLVSVVCQLDPKIISEIFYREILETVTLLLDSVTPFQCELSSLANNLDPELSKGSEGSSLQTDERLVSVGRVWANCDQLIKLIDEGKLGLLSRKIKQSILLIDDGLDEFSLWIEDPGSFNNDSDPFDLNDEDSDAATPPSYLDEEKSLSEDEGSLNEEVKRFASLWLKKINLIKLLLSSTTKSLPIMTSGENINQVYEIQKKLVTLIDKLIVDLMLDAVLDEEVEKITLDIDEYCSRLAKIVKDTNEKSPNKIKWCEAWLTKYQSTN